MKINHFFLLNIILSVLLYLMPLVSDAQQADNPPYLKQPGIPSFAMRKVPDSTLFSKKDLEKGKPVIFMIFGPECSHCEDQVKAMQAHAELFRDTRIIMYTSVKFDVTRKFYQTMNMAGYPMFTMGVDPLFSLASFLRFKSLPTLFLYDRQGKFVRKFEGSELSPELIASEIR